MSQDINTMTKRPRRTRAQRNRPVLVTNTETTEAAETGKAVATETELEPKTDELTSAETESSEPAAETEQKTTQRRIGLPGFFSSVIRGEKDSAPTQEEVVEARMARAHKNAASSSAKEQDTKPEQKAVTKATTKPSTNARTAPPKLFKTRHLIGLAVYLIAANFILPYEKVFVDSLHAEKILVTIPGLNLPIETSFLLNIATLIVLLYVLVVFDFLPSGKKYGEEQAKLKQKAALSAGQPGQPNPRQIPPAVRPGQLGEDDDLYKNYRLNQRRKK